VHHGTYRSTATGFVLTRQLVSVCPRPTYWAPFVVYSSPVQDLQWLPPRRRSVTIRAAGQVLLLHANVAPVCSTKRSRLPAALVSLVVMMCVLIPSFSSVVLARQRKASGRRNKLHCYVRQRSWSADMARAVSRDSFQAGRAAGLRCTSKLLGGRRQLPLSKGPSRKRRRRKRRLDVPCLLPQRAGHLLMSVLFYHPATWS